MRTSYDHDEVWLARKKNKSPYWGPHSTRVYRGLLTMLAKTQPPPGRVFDAGCGAGAFGIQATEAGYQYCGVDDSREGIEFGKEAFLGIELHCVDVAKVNPRDEWLSAFHVVAAVNVLHCLIDDDDRRRFLKYLNDVCAGDGVLALTTMCAPMEDDYRASPRPRVFKDARDIEAEIIASGFSRIEETIFELAQGRAKVSNLALIARK